MLTLLLVRHGETECNVRDVLCGGGCDAPLTARGRDDARGLADLVGRLTKPGRVITSPLQRAAETAAPIARALDVRVEADPRWREIDYGGWDGLTDAAARAEHPELHAAFRATPSRAGAPDGETAGEVHARVLAALGDLRAAHRDGALLVVSHKTALRVLCAALLGVSIDDYRRLEWPPATLSILTLDRHGACLHAHGLRP